MTDKAKVLEWLRAHGTITPMEALRGFGCYRLGARIWDLRHKDGFDIETHMEYRINEDGEISKWAVYILKGDQNG